MPTRKHADPTPSPTLCRQGSGEQRRSVTCDARWLVSDSRIEGLMSDDVLSIFPADPYWQPEQGAADRAAALAEGLAPGVPDGVDVEIDVTWHETLTVVDCGTNLEKINCPLCGASIDTEWWADILETH